MKKIFIVLFIITTINSFGQNILLRLNVKQGDVYQMDITTNLHSSDITSTSTEKIKRTFVSVDNKKIIAEAIFEKITEDIIYQGNHKINFDSDMKESELTSGAKMLYEKHSMKLKLSSITTYDKLGNTLEMRLKDGEDISLNLIQSNTNNLVYPKGVITLGSSWNVETTDYQLVYKVSKIDINLVNLEFKGISKANSSIKGAVIIDKESGMELSRKAVEEFNLSKIKIETIIKHKKL